MLKFKSNLDRFMRFISADEKSGCWLWTGFVCGHTGYGDFTLRHGRGEYTRCSAHRASWLLLRGDTKGLWVLHRCDVRHCVNPDHLFLGTAKDNTKDMIDKGRRVAPSTKNRARGDNHPSRTKPECLVRGVNHHSAKIDENDVRKIRASKRKGVELSKMFKLTPVTISRIKRRLIWRHVP